MRRGRQRENSNKGSKGGGTRCSRRKLHRRVLQENLVVVRHHRRNTGELHMGGGELIASHPVSATIGNLV